MIWYRLTIRLDARARGLPPPVGMLDKLVDGVRDSLGEAAALGGALIAATAAAALGVDRLLVQWAWKRLAQLFDAFRVGDDAVGAHRRVRVRVRVRCARWLRVMQSS